MQLLHFPVLILLLLTLIGGGNADYSSLRPTLTADKNTTGVSGEVKLTCTYHGNKGAGVKYDWFVDGDREPDLGTSSVSTLQYKHAIKKMVYVSCLVNDMDGSPLAFSSDRMPIRFTASRAALTADTNTTDVSGGIKLRCTKNGLEDVDFKYEWYLDGNREKDLGTKNVLTLQYKHVLKDFAYVRCRVDDPMSLVSLPQFVAFDVSRATLTADKNTTDVSGEVELTCTYNGQEDAGVKYEWFVDGYWEQDLGNSSVSTLQYKPAMEKKMNVSCLVTDMDGNPITRVADRVIIHFTGSSAVCIGSGVILPLLLVVTSYMSVW